MKNSRITLVVAGLGIVLLTGYIFRIQILMGVSLAEFSLLSGKFQTGSALYQCQPDVLYHRGYALGGLWPENSSTSFTAAVNDGVKALEIDLSLDGDQVYVGHELGKKTYRLSDFRNVFRQKFQSIIFDLKEIKGDYGLAKKELLELKSDFSSVRFVGRKCDLLNDLHSEGADVSCEAMGAISHMLLGWNFWSVDYRILGYRYKKLLSEFNIPLLVWTWPERSTVNGLCELNPESVLIEK